MAHSDLKSHALSASEDFYALLGVPVAATESDIHSAWRKTAFKYHPDKVGPNNHEALEKFHLLAIAQDVLCDPTVRALYDNARKAREEKKLRDEALDGRRRWMKEDLERREGGALKRKREEMQAEEAFERELRRIAEDGKRRRKEREEQLRREASEVEEETRRENGDAPHTHEQPASGPEEIDRSVKLRFKKVDSTQHLDREGIISLFSRFGPIEGAILRDKKIKSEGEKHRQPYITAILVFKSVVGAHAAVTDLSKLRKEDPTTWAKFEKVGWAAGKEPDFIPKPPAVQTPNKVKDRSSILGATPGTPQPHGDALKRVPSFASFKGTPTAKGAGAPASDEIMMIRLKNAEKRASTKEELVYI
jgi:DnaJ homolog subfamily C member 17